MAARTEVFLLLLKSTQNMLARPLLVPVRVSYRLPGRARGRSTRAVLSAEQPRAGRNDSRTELNRLRSYLDRAPAFSVRNTLEAALPLARFNSGQHLWPTLVPRESYVAYHTLEIVVGGAGRAHADFMLAKAKRFTPLGKRRADMLRPMHEFAYVVDFVDQLNADELDTIGV